MLIDEAFYRRLSGIATITDLIGNRIYPQFVPQHGGSYPCIVYSFHLEIRGKSNAGTNGLNKGSMAISCLAGNDVDAFEIGAALVSAIKNDSRTTWGGDGGVKIAKCDIASDDEAAAQMIGVGGVLKFAAVFEAELWYVEQ